jgi:hypothetical protein
MLVAVAIFSSAVIGHADNAPSLPSQKASVVIPLLEKMKRGADPSKIAEILGVVHAGAMDRGLTPIGPVDAGHVQLYCVLDDGSRIDVSWQVIPEKKTDRIESIDLKRPGRSPEQIYPPSK